LSPENGCIIDMKWKLGSLSYHASAAGKEVVPVVKDVGRLPEIVIYDHIGFKGAYARTNLSFHYIGDYWTTESVASSWLAVSGVSTATTIMAALPGNLAPVTTKAFLRQPARTTRLARFKPSR